MSEKIEKSLSDMVKDRGSNLKQHNEPMVNSALKLFKMEESKSVMTALPADMDLRVMRGSAIQNMTPYGQLMGMMMHQTNTICLDISFAVNFLARHMHQTTGEFWMEKKHTLRYLKGKTV